MLRELIRTWLVDCPRFARRLGLAHEHAAIAARHRRVRTAWAPHLAESRKTILAAAERCAKRERVFVIGAGDCLDVPVAELAERFDEVVLADVVVSPVARKLAQKCGRDSRRDIVGTSAANHARGRGRVICAAWDATGALERVAARADDIKSADVRRIFEEADPGLPPGGEPDLIISANCLSQLGLVPGHSLRAVKLDDELPGRCGVAAAKRHLAWLAQRPGGRVLIADVARLDVACDGRVLQREDLRGRYSLRVPDKTWRWDLAPIPEWDRKYHRVHEVGAWIDDG